MPEWKYKVNLRDVFHMPDLTYIERRDKIVLRIRESDWYRDHAVDDLEDILLELEDAENTGEFNAAWNDLYDVANEHRAWIATR